MEVNHYAKETHSAEAVIVNIGPHGFRYMHYMYIIVGNGGGLALPLTLLDVYPSSCILIHCDKLLPSGMLLPQFSGIYSEQPISLLNPSILIRLYKVVQGITVK